MAETAIAAVLSKFGELAANEAKILLEVGDNMTLLRDRLEWLQAFVRDADRKRRAGADPLTRVLVRQTRDVAFEAEDALDEFFYEVDLSQGYQCWKMWRRYLTGCSTQLVIRHRLSAQIKTINMRLEKISEYQKEYNIEHTPLAPLTSSTTATSAWMGDAVALGDNVEMLKEMLCCRDRTRLMFISVLGESGVGKRTLVEMVCKEHEVETMFEGNTLNYNISPDCTVDHVLEVIASLHQPNYDIDITDKIQRIFAGKRFLLILGGISSKTMLNCLRASLPDDSNGSRVVLILDTGNEEIAWHANTMNQGDINGIHLLSRLDEQRSGLLFCSRAFGKKLSYDEKEDITKKTLSYDEKEAMTKKKLSYDEKEDMTKYNQIVYDITGGYPLAIVVLAGLLRFKERPGQWEAVLQQLRPGAIMEEAQGGEGNKIIEAVQSKGKHIEWQMSPATQANNKLSTRTTIERVLWASFEDLPNDLKSCFLYFVALPKNMRWSAIAIVLMWMAEGFIKPQKGKTMEELGFNYLKELVLRCLVQIDGMNEVGGIESVSIHRSLHGFLQSEAREAGFMEVHDMHDVFVPPSVRRLSFTSFGGRYTPFNQKFRKLRSFICWVEEEHRSNASQGVNKRHWHDLSFLCGSKFLRAILVDGIRIKQLPNKISEMIHLRCLIVHHCQDLKELPPSIRRLLNLQTLDIRDSQVKNIHPGFWKIRTLRHVLADELTLPETIEEEMDELQTLYGVKPAAEGEWKQQDCPLHKMTKLRTLKLHGIEHGKHGAALESALAKMHLLGELDLQGDVIPSCVFTSRSLRYLETVRLDGNVKWPDSGWDCSKVRPNLVLVKLGKNQEVPQHIKNQNQFEIIPPEAHQDTSEL